MVDTTTGIAIAMYWKNGTPVYLSDGSSNAYANAITVGSDIYVAGSVNNRAVYWKNGISYNLQANNLVCFSASSIALNGSDVYILGTMTSALGTDPSDYAPTNFIYWKNGVASSTFGYILNSYLPVGNGFIYLDGNDIYTIENDGGSRYLKNGINTNINVAPNTATNLTNITIVSH